MRKIFSVSTACIFLFISCTDKEKENAVHYNDAIVKEVSKADSLVQIVLDYEKMFSSYPSLKNALNGEFDQLDASLQNIPSMPGDDTLRQNAIQLVDIYKEMLNNDFASMYEIMTDSTYTEVDSMRVDSLMFEMYSKWQVQSGKVATYQQHFAKRHGIVLEKK